MLHFLHLLRSILYTVLIMGIPMLIMTGGKISATAMQHPAFQFLTIIVFAYAAAPVISDFAGGHIGRSLFFPNRANLDHPTMSHIISLRNKRHYREAMEELRMLTDLHPTELEPYKMLLHLTAHELPDRRTFDMIYRKGMHNLEDKRHCELLSRYRDEHVQHKENSEEEWHETSHQDKHTEGTSSVDLYVNKRHHEKDKKESKKERKRDRKRENITHLHSATLPPREKISRKDEVASNQKLILAKIAQDYTTKEPSVTPVAENNEEIATLSVPSAKKDTLSIPVVSVQEPKDEPMIVEAPSMFNDDEAVLSLIQEDEEEMIIKGFGDDNNSPTPVKFVFRRQRRK